MEPGSREIGISDGTWGSCFNGLTTCAPAEMFFCTKSDSWQERAGESASVVAVQRLELCLDPLADLRILELPR